MGSLYTGAPRDLVLWLRDTFKIGTFVETGTNRAKTTMWAAAEFQRVFTVEGSEPLYKSAVASFGKTKNVDFLFGDSRDHIKRIVESERTPAMFWLDAHWCGEQSAGSTDECPVIGELGSLNSSTVEHFILIDDARLFLSPPPPPHDPTHWPDIAAICRELEHGGASRYVAVYEDVIIGVPQHAKPALVEFLRQDIAKRQSADARAFSSIARRGISRLRRRLSP